MYSWYISIKNIDFRLLLLSFSLERAKWQHLIGLSFCMHFVNHHMTSSWRHKMYLWERGRRFDINRCFSLSSKLFKFWMIKASADFDLSKKDVPYSESIFYRFHTHTVYKYVQVLTWTYQVFRPPNFSLRKLRSKHLNIRPPVSNIK